MDPQNSPTPQPQGPLPGQEPPAPPSTTPDWQQGLGQPATPPPSVMPPAPTPPGPGVVVGGAPIGSPAPAAPGVPGPEPGPQNWPGQPATPPVSPTPGVPMMGANGTQPKKVPVALIVVLVVIAVLVLGAITYFMFFSKSANNAAKKSSNNVANATNLDTLSHLSFNAPSSMTGFTERSVGLSNVKDYVSADGNCEFIFGTVTSAQLPGVDLNAIIQPQVDLLKKAGATVTGPGAGKALVVKGGGKNYSMPTLNFEFSEGTKHATIHYSAVILKSNDRAIVNRTCINKDGAVDPTRVQALDNKAAELTITVKD